MTSQTWQEIQDIAKERDGVIYRLGYESAIGLKTTELKMAKDNLSVILNDKIKLLLSQQRKEIEEIQKDNILGTVILNCTGFIERDGEKLWQLDMESLEKDLKN